MKVSNDIIDILQDSTIMDDGIQLVGQLDTKTYKDVDKVIKAMGGKWNPKKGYHFFEYYDPQEKLDILLETGEIISEQQAFQFFATPIKIIQKMDEYVRHYGDDDMRILEPSAGDGKIADYLKNRYPEKFENVTIHCCELNPRLVDKLKAKNHKVVATDFLSYQPEELYDVIVANPPFCNKQDIDHVYHMYDCVRMGGGIVSIMNAGVLTNSDKKTVEFREFVRNNCGEFISIDSNSFKESGTTAATCIVILFKVGN